VHDVLDLRTGNALDHPQPVLPMMPGMPARTPHPRLLPAQDHKLFAAFNTTDDTVISELYRRHRAIKSKKFLIRIDKAVPTGLDVHLVCDNNASTTLRDQSVAQ
jgi:hypothetical protein